MNNYDYTRRVFWKILRQYSLSLLASVGMVSFLAVGCTIFFSTFDFWRKSVVLRYVLSACADYMPLLFLTCTAVCWLGCTVHFIRKPLDLLDELAEAVDILTRPEEEESIVLSPELSEMEEHLNLAKNRAIRAAYAAREAEQRKNDLVVYLAHDLKTPLTSVIGYLTLLRDEPDLSPALRARYTNVALDKAERLEDLINEFFDVTRFNLTHMELEKRPVDLVRMLQQVAGEFQPEFDKHGLVCRLDLPAAMECVCDPDKLARVFDNLLRNACHYSAPGTEVAVAAAAEEGGTVLTFTNTGATIPPEKLSRIFEQFFRLDASRASRTGGAGLGLAIAKEIVELHGGSISVQSAGGVTTFSVRLPAP